VPGRGACAPGILASSDSPEEAGEDDGEIGYVCNLKDKSVPKRVSGVSRTPDKEGGKNKENRRL